MGNFDHKDIETMGIEIGSEAFNAIRDGATQAEAVLGIINEREYDEPGIHALLGDTVFIEGIEAGIALGRYEAGRST